MNTDIFITSAIRHYPWLVCCLRTIEKHCHGFRQTVLVADEKYSDRWNELARRFPFLRVVLVPEHGDGHLVQMAHKTGAYKFTDADLILYADADYLFRQSCVPDDFMRDGKPLLVMSSYESLRHAHVAPDGSTHPVPWQPVTEKAFGGPVEFEYMRIPGQLYPRWLPQLASAYISKQFNMPAKAYILSCEPTPEWPRHGYCEFNFMGAVAHKLHPDKFSLFDLMADSVATGKLMAGWPIDQCWTHGDTSQSPWRERIAAVLGSG